MHPYQLKSAQKELNGEPLEGYGVYCGDELRFFAHAFDYRWVRDFVNHINEAFYIFDMHTRNKL